MEISGDDWTADPEPELTDQELLLYDAVDEGDTLIIILDACRYNSLQHTIDEQVYNVDTPAVNTHQWMRMVWNDEYEATYISPNPFCSDNVVNGYRGSEHFERIVPVWKNKRDKNLGTVVPYDISYSTLQHEGDNPVTISHFIQPHLPHIHPKYEMGGPHGDNTFNDLSERVSHERLRETYKKNLIHVLRFGVKPLIGSISYYNRVIITADHGECLGEDGNWGHNVDSPYVRKVPWISLRRS